jgi:hypothetical protein
MKNLYLKLAEVKREVGKVSKNSKNPHFKNTYADLNALIDAVEPILLEKGLLMLQPIQNGNVTTIIIDCESSESIESSIALPALSDPQKLGSAITYFRRYTLQSLLSLMAEDDDGNKASKPNPKQTLTADIAKANADLGVTLESMIQTFEMTVEQQTKYKSLLNK